MKTTHLNIFEPNYNVIFLLCNDIFKNILILKTYLKRKQYKKIHFLSLLVKEYIEISIKENCLKLGISIDKYYRYKKSLD